MDYMRATEFGKKDEIQGGYPNKARGHATFELSATTKDMREKIEKLRRGEKLPADSKDVNWKVEKLERTTRGIIGAIPLEPVNRKIREDTIE